MWKLWIEMSVPLRGLKPLQVGLNLSPAVASCDYVVGNCYCHGRLIHRAGRGDLPSNTWGKEAGRKITCNFINLSSQEALFHMGTQVTGYEKVASGCPDHVQPTMQLCAPKEGRLKSQWSSWPPVQRGSEAWLKMNSTLFRHALEYQNKLNDFLTESTKPHWGIAWPHLEVVLKVMEDARAPVSNGLGIAGVWWICLPPSQYTWLSIPLCCCSPFTPEVYGGQPGWGWTLRISCTCHHCKWPDGIGCAVWRDY